MINEKAIPVINERALPEPDSAALDAAYPKAKVEEVAKEEEADDEAEDA